MRIVRPAALVLLLPALVLVPAVSSAAAQRKPSAKSMAKSTVQMVPMRTIAGRDQTGGGFGEILDLALDDHRTLYVCDARSADIRKFDDFGTLLGTIGRKGSGSGELDRPVEVEVRGDRVFVRDLGRSRMFLEGRLVSSTPVDEREGRWRKFRALPDGRFVVERETAGETRLELCSAGISPQKTLYRKAVPSNRISAGPLRKDIPLPFAPVVEWDLTPEGLIVAGYSGDYSLEILDPDKGRLAAWTRSFKPFEVTEKDRKDYLAGPGRDLPPAAARTLVRRRRDVPQPGDSRGRMAADGARGFFRRRSLDGRRRAGRGDIHRPVSNHQLTGGAGGPGLFWPEEKAARRETLRGPVAGRGPPP